MRINIVGEILSTSGYSSHCRQLFNHLYKQNPDIKLDVPLSQDYLNHVNDAELEAIKKPVRIPDVTIGIMTPPNWRIALADQSKKFVGFCVWEGDKIPFYWIEYLLDERVDQIWVPSQHTKDAIINTYCDCGLECHKCQSFPMEKVHVIPHGVDIDLFKSKEKEDDGTFRFLCVKGWRGGMDDRGGVQYLLKAFTEEFGRDEKVELNLHLNPAYINSDSIKTHMDNLELDKDSPPIKVSATNIPYKNLPALYQSSDCYVCATRAESFDLGTAEAMACGLPIITMNYGGQIEHMPECNGLIDYKLEEVKGDVQYEGIKWATPDIKHLRELMRYGYENPDWIKEIGNKNKKFIQDYTWENSAKKVLKILKEL